MDRSMTFNMISIGLLDRYMIEYLFPLFIYTFFIINIYIMWLKLGLKLNRTSNDRLPLFLGISFEEMFLED